MSNKKKNLLSLRKKIDLIDENISILLVKRICLVKKIISLKDKKELPIIDKKRELKVFKHYQIALKKYSNANRIQRLAKSIIALNPNYPITEIASSSNQTQAQ